MISNYSGYQESRIDLLMFKLEFLGGSECQNRETFYHFTLASFPSVLINRKHNVICIARRKGLHGVARGLKGGRKNAQIPIGTHNFFEPTRLPLLRSTASRVSVCRKQFGKWERTQNHEQLSPPFHDYIEKW